MRWSDIQKLTWGEVQELDGHTRIVFRQKKTKGFEYLDISDQATRYLGERGKSEDRVFFGLKYSAWHNQALEKWCMKAGILKDITFHCGRHTFATLLVVDGVDIYKISKYLGHKSVNMTQRYLKYDLSIARESARGIHTFS